MNQQVRQPSAAEWSGLKKAGAILVSRSSGPVVHPRVRSGARYW
jgi:hypothetical protein